MAKIPLRAYNREIEGMIDQGQTLEAVAHCQHILKTFPKCLDTYRLLGKAYLELQRFTEAGDVFNRLLLAVPEDFIANLGMSIIYDDQKNLDAAIWHMERAFETQSSNPAIQGELRRLYSRRDGMEPPKIRLTRGALAQMYARGDQYPQAVSEIRSVLAEEPQRMDLLVLLARVYFRAGQKVEATEICTNLLKRYPYCLDANRILVEILPETTRADSTQVYRHRVNALDPYSAFAAPSVFASAEVADAAVTIERLVYQADAWAPSKFGLETAKQEATPDWVTNQGTAPVETPIEPISEENVPEWMKAAGWAATTAAAAEAVERASAGTAVEPEEAAVPAASEDLSSGEVPDWLKMMAPPGALDQSAPEAAPDVTVSSEDMNWLESLGAPGSGGPADQVGSPVEPISGEGLSALGGVLGAGAAVGAVLSAREEEPAEIPARPAEQTPDWLTQLGTPEPVAAPASEAPAAQPAEDLPDWLTNAAGSELPAQLPTQTQAEPVDSDLPDWLRNADGGFGAESTPLPVVETPASQPMGTADNGLPVSDDDAFAWLESLAAKQGAKSEELLTKPEDRPGETPDWLGKLREPEKPAESGIGIGGAVAAASFFGDEQPEEDKSTSADKTLISAAEQPAPAAAVPPAQAMSDEDAFSWLESLAAKQGANPEELLTKPEERAESAPEWATQMGMDSTSVIQPDAAQPGLNMEQQGDLSWLQSFGGETPTEESTIGEQPLEEIIFAQPSDSLFEEKPAAVEPVAGAPVVESASADEVAEWLHQLDAEDAAGPSAALEQKPVFGAEELPDWLKEEEPAELPSEELPDWLKGETTELPPVKPATQADWQPEPPPVELVPIFAAAETTPPAEEAAPAKNIPAVLLDAALGITAKPVKGPSASAEKDKALFENSQLELQRGNLNEAMQGYGKLIKKGKMLDEIIFDLREALYRHPVDVVIWQTLGDAYMRAQRLQDALDAYTKAEELLR
jgi:tetratricopeptide (TPR) repeat protein